MKQTSRIILALILAVAILLPNLFSSPLGVAADSQLHRYVRISPSTETGLDSLGIHPFHKIDYGAFVWLELSQADFARLSRQIAYQEDSGAGKISVAGMQFDPLVQGEPDLPARLMAAESQAGFRLVQFAAPIQDAWLKQLQLSGADPLQYYSYNAYGVCYARRAKYTLLATTKGHMSSAVNRVATLSNATWEDPLGGVYSTGRGTGCHIERSSSAQSG